MLRKGLLAHIRYEISGNKLSFELRKVFELHDSIDYVKEILNTLKNYLITRFKIILCSIIYDSVLKC